MICIWPGGRVSLLLTDTFQGLLAYPVFVIITGYVLLNLSWSSEIAPTMMDRIPGESFLNPYDVSQLRDFNIFSLTVWLFSTLLNRASWYGNDTSGRVYHSDSYPVFFRGQLSRCSSSRLYSAGFVADFICCLRMRETFSISPIEAVER